MAGLNLIFMGSPDFAVPALQALIDAGHHIACVYAQPPRPAGRGQKERPCPVHAFAESRGLQVRTPVNLKSEDEQLAFSGLKADACVVAAYGVILPKPVLRSPRLGCLNIHASLLPRWRGAAPIQRAIIEGDRQTGITIMQMDEGLDTGDMLMSVAVPIDAQTTASGLHDALASVGAELIVKVLADVQAGTAKPARQDDAAATYAAKLGRGEGRIDWHQESGLLERRIRALSPSPGVWFEHDGKRIKVLAAVAGQGSGAPGTVLDDRLTVACGTGTLSPVRVQLQGRSESAVADFLRGYDLPAGTVLD